jgi:putative MATE family efflux protein
MYLDQYAFAAVGMTAVISNTLISLTNGFTQGFGILVSNSFGAREMPRLRRCVAGSIILTIFLIIVLTTVAFVFIHPILKLLNTPDEVMEYALKYIRIIIGGIGFAAVYNLCANILRALGDSRTPLYFLILSVLLNLGTDILFVGILNLGIAGAAYATVISQMICCILCIIYILTKYRYILPHREDWAEMKCELSNLFTTGLSMGLMGCIVNIGTIILQFGINNLGSDIMAAHVAGRRIFDLTCILIFTFGITMTTYVSQNTGAGRLDRVQEGARKGTGVAMATSAVITALILIFGKYLMALFTNTEALVEQSYHMMMILGVGYIAMEVTQCLQGIMRGAGDTMSPMWLSMISTVILRVPLAYLMTWMTRSPENPNGVFAMMFVSLLITWIIGAAMTVVVYKVGKWKEKALVFSS